MVVANILRSGKRCAVLLRVNIRSMVLALGVNLLRILILDLRSLVYWATIAIGCLSISLVRILDVSMKGGLR